MIIQNSDHQLIIAKLKLRIADEGGKASDERGEIVCRESGSARREYKEEMKTVNG